MAELSGIAVELHNDLGNDVGRSSSQFVGREVLRVRIARGKVIDHGVVTSLAG